MQFKFSTSSKKNSSFKYTQVKVSGENGILLQRLGRRSLLFPFLIWHSYAGAFSNLSMGLVTRD